MTLSPKPPLTIDLAVLMSALSTPLCILDSDHVIVQCNPAMAQLFNKPEEQIRCNTFLTILSEVGTVRPPPTKVIFYPTILHSTEIVGAGDRTFTVTIDPVVENGTILYSIQTTREHPGPSAVIPDSIDGKLRVPVETLYYGIISDLMNLLSGNIGLAEIMLKKKTNSELVERCTKSIIQANTDMAENIKNFRTMLRDLLQKDTTSPPTSNA